MTRVMTIRPGTLVHGSENTYRNHKCRCGPCKHAHTVWFRARRRENYARRILVGGVLIAPFPADRHGSTHLYQHYGCRCDPCCDAATATRQKYRQSAGVAA